MLRGEFHDYLTTFPRQEINTAPHNTARGNLRAVHAPVRRQFISEPAFLTAQAPGRVPARQARVCLRHGAEYTLSYAIAAGESGARPADMGGHRGGGNRIPPRYIRKNRHREKCLRPRDCECRLARIRRRNKSNRHDRCRMLSESGDCRQQPEQALHPEQPRLRISKSRSDPAAGIVPARVRL